MEAVAHNPAFAKRVGISQSVGKDFSAADKGKKFGRGGMPAINKQDTQHGSMDMPFKSLKKFGGMKSGGMARGGMPPEAMRRRPRMGAGMPPPAPPVMPPQPPAPMGMKKGGMAGMHKMPDGKMMKDSAMKKGGMPMKDGKPAFMKKMNMGGMAGYATGGNMNPKGATNGSSRAGENIRFQKKGLTEGRVIKMASGGSVSARADGIASKGKTKGKMC